MKAQQETGYRTERDPIDEKKVPAGALYKCVRLIKPHPDEMREYAERSVGIAALYNEERGFMGAAELAQKAIETGKSVKEVAAEE